MSPPSLALDLNPFRDVWHRQGHLCPPPSQKLGGARVPSFRRSSLACYKFRDVWHRPGHLCPPPLLKLWVGHVLPSPFPLLIHSEMGLQRCFTGWAQGRIQNLHCRGGTSDQWSRRLHWGAKRRKGEDGGGGHPLPPVGVRGASPGNFLRNCIKMVHSECILR